MRLRWLIAMFLVGPGVVAASWGLFDIVQIGECGGEGAKPCPTEIIKPIMALAGGLAAAIIGTVFGRSGRLLVALFGLLLATGALAVYLSLFGPNAEPGTDPVEAAKLLPAGLGGLGILLLLVSAKANAPRISSGGGGGGSWGDGGWGGDSDSGSGCSSGCGGGCGGGD